MASLVINVLVSVRKREETYCKILFLQHTFINAAYRATRNSSRLKSHENLTDVRSDGNFYVLLLWINDLKYRYLLVYNRNNDFRNNNE